MAERKNLGWSAQLNQWGDATGTDHYIVEYVDGTKKPLCGSKASMSEQWARKPIGHACVQCTKKLNRG